MLTAEAPTYKHILYIMWSTYTIYVYLIHITFPNIISKFTNTSEEPLIRQDFCRKRRHDEMMSGDGAGASIYRAYGDAPRG